MFLGSSLSVFFAGKAQHFAGKPPNILPVRLRQRRPCVITSHSSRSPHEARIANTPTPGSMSGDGRKARAAAVRDLQHRPCGQTLAQE
jgi:hypothetical protein